MTNSELTLAALTNGLEDDGTTAAALDAIREESGCSLLAAVLEVARVHRATHDTRDIKAATSHLDADSPIRTALHRAILDECIDIRPGDGAMVLVVAGDARPAASREDVSGTRPGTFIVSVGARWALREASRLLIELHRKQARVRRRKPRSR